MIEPACLYNIIKIYNVYNTLLKLVKWLYAHEIPISKFSE